MRHMSPIRVTAEASPGDWGRRQRCIGGHQCPPPMWAPISWRCAPAAGRFVHDAAFAHHHNAVGQLQQFVQVFADQQHRPALGAHLRMRLWISFTAAKSSPNTGLAAISTLMSPASSRASTARCTLPPDRLRIGAPSPWVLMPYSAIHCGRGCARRQSRNKRPGRAAGQWRLVEVAQGHVLGHAQVAHTGIAQRLFGQAAHFSRRFSSRRAHRAGPLTSTVPARRGRWPTRASTSSRWPLPDTPATPRISPGPRQTDALHRQRAAVAHRTRSCSTCSAGTPFGIFASAPCGIHDFWRLLIWLRHGRCSPRPPIIAAASRPGWVSPPRRNGAPPCPGAAPSPRRHRP
jgi:hypothetical protein